MRQREVWGAGRLGAGEVETKKKSASTGWTPSTEVPDERSLGRSVVPGHPDRSPGERKHNSSSETRQDSRGPVRPDAQRPRPPGERDPTGPQPSRRASSPEKSPTMPSTGLRAWGLGSGFKVSG